MRIEGRGRTTSRMAGLLPIILTPLNPYTMGQIGETKLDKE